jgi:prepilin-type processing-associated H-X9-DG protein
MDANWGNLNATEQAALSSIPYLLCPSRRSGTQMRQSGSYRGPLSDYSASGYDTNSVVFNQYHDAYNTTWISHQRGMLQVGLPLSQTTAGYAGAKGRDSFARVTDGLSNTLLIGEKAVGNQQRGVCCGSSGADGSFLYAAASWREFSVGSSTRLRLGQGPSDNARPDNGMGHGSWHPGICNFVFGDGSVRSVNVTVSLNVLGNLGNCMDGNAVTLN